MKKAMLSLTLCAATVCSVMVCPVVVAAQTAADKKPASKAAPKTSAKAAPAPAAKPAPPVAQPLVIPKDAVQQADGSFRYTDKNGKRWVYNNTFFGVSRMEDMSDPNAPAIVKQAPAFDKFTEDGDVIRFERNGPFGPMKWERKKADLTEEERQAIADFKLAEKK